MYTPPRTSSAIDLTYSPQFPLPEPITVGSTPFVNSPEPDTSSQDRFLTLNGLSNSGESEHLAPSVNPSGSSMRSPPGSSANAASEPTSDVHFHQLSLAPSSSSPKHPLPTSSQQDSEIPPQSSPGSDKPRTHGTSAAKYTCPICFSPPKDAVITECGHIMCGHCLFSAVRAARARSLGTPQNASAALCPVCRNPIKGWDWRGGGVTLLNIKGFMQSRAKRFKQT